MQIIGDGNGNVIHLWERDCSVQRRHQKVIEMAPAWSLPDDLRAELHRYALDLTSRAKYKNAGTVEFLVDSMNRPYFIEVNPRIQVRAGGGEEKNEEPRMYGFCVCFLPLLLFFFRSGGGGVGVVFFFVRPLVRVGGFREGWRQDSFPPPRT